MKRYDFSDIIADFHALTCLSLAGMLPDEHPVDHTAIPRIDLPFFQYPGRTLDDYVCSEHGAQKCYSVCECLRNLSEEHAHMLMDAIEEASAPLFELIEVRWRVPADFDEFVKHFGERLVDLSRWLDIAN